MSTYIFGDSFVGPFNLVDDKQIKINKFKGATMKGLLKDDNENRKKIIEIIKDAKNIGCIIFNFGQVDLYFSYYYKRFIKKKRFIMEPMIKKYVEFINNIDCKNCNKIIFSVYPSPLKDENVFNSLINYGILSEKNVESISKMERQKLSNYKFRFNMYKKFNNLLEKYSKMYKINYINFENVLLNKDHTLKKDFINPANDTSIHLLWEPLIPIILSKIEQCRIKKEYKFNLENTLKKYIKEKHTEINNRKKTKNIMNNMKNIHL